MPGVAETVVNVKLAEILSELGIDARAERLRGRRRPDIMCYYRGLIVGIEASYSRLDAERDAEERLGEGLVDVAIALWLRERYEDVSEPSLKKLIKGSKFDVRVLVPIDVGGTLIPFIEKSTGRMAEPATGWFRDVDIPLLKTIIESATTFLAREEEVQKLVTEVRQRVADFTRALASADVRGSTRRGIYEELYKLYGLSVAEAEDPEVAFGHAALSILLSTVFYEHVRSAHPQLRHIMDYVNRYGPIDGLVKALEELLKIDYRVAVETTIKILRLLPSRVSPRVLELVRLAIKIAQSPSLLRRDFAGRIYHEITGDIALRKGFATFYTEVPAAYLLASLAAHSLLELGENILKLGKDRAQEILERVRSLKVGDLACGSGTLLTAAYSSLTRIATMLKYYHNLDADLEEICKTLVEGGIHGIDALRYASQITAINLALVGPGTITKENVYTIYLGYIPGRGKPWLGSLELLDNSRRVGGILAYIEGGLRGVAEKTTVEGVGGEITIPSKFDMIIMNPPFTRATGRTERFGAGRGLFGFIADESTRQKLVKAYKGVRDRVREELRAIARANARLFPEVVQEIIGGTREFGPYIDIGQAGEGLLFLYLAYKYVGDGGIIAFVLPRSILAGASWFLARALLAAKFHVLYVIVSSDPEGGYNFSEGASLSEALIVARRVSEHSTGEKTVFVNLLRKPKGMLEGMLLGVRISEDGFESGYGLVEELGGIASVHVVGREELLNHIDNWNRFVALPDHELVDMVLDIIDNNTIKIGYHKVRIPMARFNELIERLGIDRHQFNDHFRKVDISTPYPIIYGGGEEVRTMMTVEHNAYAEPKASRAGELYGEYSGRIMIPSRFWLDTVHAISMLSKEPVLSNMFYAVRLKVPDERKERAEKALVLWFNTMWGLLTILVNRQETRGRWSELAMAHWRMLPVLDVSSLDDEALRRLARVFDRYAGRQLKRIPRQFNPKSPDPVRLGMDAEFLKALNPRLEDEVIREHLLELYKHVSNALEQWMGSN